MNENSEQDTKWLNKSTRREVVNGQGHKLINGVKKMDK